MAWQNLQRSGAPQHALTMQRIHLGALSQVMRDEELWQQHFPTYRFAQRDVVLAEYESAAKSLEAEERLFVTSSNVTLVVAAGAGSIALNSVDRLYQATGAFLSSEFTFLAILSLLAAFAMISLKYFAERQKDLVFAKRKVVVVRRMLGLSYGSFQLVLPNWRLEGADEPFAIRLFPGWLSYVAYPFWIVVLFSSASLGFFTAHFVGSNAAWRALLGVQPEGAALLLALSWLSLCAVIYRVALFDTHERLLLKASQVLAAVLRVRLVGNVEQVMYRAKLAHFEQQRLGYTASSAHKLLVLLEDRRFYRHSGVDWRGVARAVRNNVCGHRRSGGSSISQQLARSLFIVDYRKVFRRKVLEFPLAWWLEDVVGKHSILDLYLACVRFDSQVYGLASASRSFFDIRLGPIGPAHTFVLLERVANVRGRVLAPRIDDLLASAVAADVLTREQAAEATDIYTSLVGRGRLQPADAAGFERLKTRWRLSRGAGQAE